MKITFELWMLLLGGPGALIACIQIWIWLRKTVWPLKEDDKVLRQPGEGARARLSELDEQAVTTAACVVAGPPLTAGFVVLVAKGAGIEDGFLQGAIVAYMGTVLFFCRRMMVIVRERSAWRLGYAGERYVADKMASLSLKGWVIFHDVPCPMGNIDHVAIGPGGVFAIETKTRRKRTKTKGAHVLKYDGKRLVWPDGFECKGLDQVENNAAWLSRRLREKTGRHVHVGAIVTVPGWFIETAKNAKNERMASVVNAKSLALFLGRTRSTAGRDDVRECGKVLAEMCRDVEL